ncbi:class I SAM-dependent methyltransferase [Sulfurimonas sp. C5]|uniref:class I SAM-dependent methyltransferase n=1 Tax=Sulfurimonas sp. C5 TaxID=3036947 RepID=UPI00245440BC|nr:class I SAM-dependent methyltransferase [Sulfurimonas sp. C5]MDH4944121.1 class I SAM-dependent methyltransferase [Sulfurimonas sp. C5]
MNQTCRLCSTSAEPFYKEKQNYFQCPKCKAIFTAFEDLPSSTNEKERYEMHTTEIDEGYKKFVSPIVTHVLQDFKEENKGLDFGAGRSKIVTKLLQEHNYNIRSFDPFFENKIELLKEKYDYITSCEVVEHFYEPRKEFLLLKSMLQDGGKLYLMTELYDESIDFASWYYKNDPTHVFLYTRESLEWIQKAYGFKDLKIEKRLIVFTL